MAAKCFPCHKSTEYLEHYSHFVQGTSDDPKHVIKSLWHLWIYTSSTSKKSANQRTLDKYVFKKLKTCEVA
jgi:hypothetical protein